MVEHLVLRKVYQKGFLRFFHSRKIEGCSTWSAQIHKTSQMEKWLPYPPFFPNCIGFLGLAFPYVMSFVTQEDI